MRVEILYHTTPASLVAAAVIVICLALVARAADGIAGHAPKARTDGGTFQAPAALAAYNAAHGRSTKGTDHGTLLGVRTGIAREQ